MFSLSLMKTPRSSTAPSQAQGAHLPTASACASVCACRSSRVTAGSQPSTSGRAHGHRRAPMPLRACVCVSVSCAHTCLCVGLQVLSRMRFRDRLGVASTMRAVCLRSTEPRAGCPGRAERAQPLLMSQADCDWGYLATKVSLLGLSISCRKGVCNEVMWESLLWAECLCPPESTYSGPNPRR